jgi:hypothetical protein
MEPVAEDIWMEGEKYITFKIKDFLMMMGALALPPWKDPKTGELVGGDMDCAPMTEKILTMADSARVPDAVVIRRQDLLAAPALATYSSMIALAAKTSDNGLQERLMKVADYFEDQAQLAADEGHKFPD